MAQPGYRHKVIKLECCVASRETKKKAVTVRLMSSKDPLQSLLSRIPNKFEFIAKMPDTAWALAINDTVIDKNDSDAFTHLLSQTEPVAVVQILDLCNLEQEKENNYLVVTFHCNGNTFDYKIQSNTAQWSNDDFITMMQSVRDKFDLKGAVDVYEDILGQNIPIDDMDDIAAAFENDDDDGDQKDNETVPMSTGTLHLFVKELKQMKVIYDDRWFMWTPPNETTEDKQEWCDNYDALLSAINREYSLSKSNIALFQNEDDEQIDCNCGDDLMAVWEALAENEVDPIAEITIVVLRDSVSTKSNENTDSESDEKGETEEAGEYTPKSKDTPSYASAMRLWFHDQIGLPQYLPLFLAKGYHDLASFHSHITEDDLVQLGVKKAAHRKIILNEIRELNAKHDTIDCDDQKHNLKANMNDEKSKEDSDDSDDTVDLRIAEVLSHLGNDIGALPASAKAMCFTNITNIKEEAEIDEKSALRFTQMFRRVCQKESVQYQDCIISFLRILQYTIKKHPKKKGSEFDRYSIKGHPNKKVLEEVTANFHHLIHAMQDPITDIYHDLDIQIPSASDAVMEHDTGIYDDAFIIFELPQILMEHQQSSLVNKTVLNPHHLERFINFMVPGSSKRLCHDIYFEKLKTQSVYPVGLFGSRREVLAMLLDFKSISMPLYNKLMDTHSQCLEPGIHCILPIHLQTANNIRKWDGMMYLFYWSLPNSFDMKKMEEIKGMRKDPACLLSRVLYEISSTVCVQVSSEELKDFGVIKRESDNLRQNQRPKRKKLNFVVEETKENHVMCEKTATKRVNVHWYPPSRNAPPSDTFIVSGVNLKLYLRLFPQQTRVIDIPETKRCAKEEELIEFFKELDAKYTIDWRSEVSHKCRYILCQAIIPKMYDEFERNGKQLKQQKLEESNAEKLKSDAKSKIMERHDDIKQEFFNLYVETEGKSQIERINDIAHSPGHSMGNELATKAAKYLTMASRAISVHSLPKQGYMDWGKDKVDGLVDRTNELIKEHKINMENGEETYREILREIAGRQKPKPKGLTGKLWSGIKNVVGLDDGEDAKHVKLTDEQWNQYKEGLISNARAAQQMAIAFRKNALIQNWCEAFDEYLDHYKRKVYKQSKSGSILDFKTVKDAMKKRIGDKYRKYQRDLDRKLFRDFSFAQQQKKHEKTASVTWLKYTQKSYSYGIQYDLRYTVPKQMPPTYSLEFVYVDLPSIHTQMRRNVAKNMCYEMRQDEELLFHHVMTNGDVIMFVSGDNDECKTHETKIVVSSGMVYPALENKFY